MTAEISNPTPRRIEFFVPGIPKPGGSKRGFFNHKTSRVIIAEDCKRNKDWRASVAQVASGVAPAELMTGALSLSVEFRLPRPKSHYRTGKRSHELRDDAPMYHTTKPDGIKLMRSTEDALTGIVWRDDAQVAWHEHVKVYTNGQAGAMVTIEALDGAKDRSAR